MLASALCKSFDARQKILIVSGKTGHRAMLLAPAAIVIFTRLADGRQPDDFLLVRDDGKPYSWIAEAFIGELSALHWTVTVGLTCAL